MMNRLFVLIVVQLAIACTINAEEYKLEQINGKYVCMGEVECKHCDNATFGAAVLWALEQAKDEKEQGGANKFDAQSMRLTIQPKLPIEGITERVYTCQLTLSVVKGKLGFLIEKAKCVPNNVLGAIAAINLDKINLEKKPQNKQYIDEFAIVCQRFINDMLSEILNREVNLNNWEAIKNGQVVKGMDQSEVKMAIGKPRDITENTQRVMWTYASGKIVVFENGIVTGMLN